VQTTSFFCLIAWFVAAREPLPSGGIAAPILLSVVAGGLNALGAASVYRAFEIGTVSLIAPIVSCYAVVTAGLSVVWWHERPNAAQLVGLLVAVAGVAGVSFVPSPAGHAARGRRGLNLAVVAALAWGVAFFLLHPAVHALGSLVPLIVVRLVSALALGAATAVRRERIAHPRAAWALLATIVVLDTGAFLAYESGVAHGLTTIVAVLSSLFSAVTALLAVIVLRERLSRGQVVAVGGVLAGVALVAAGSAP
jgi:drug/metabolite transporter (DMT)-like permease